MRPKQNWKMLSSNVKDGIVLYRFAFENLLRNKPKACLLLPPHFYKWQPVLETHFCCCAAKPVADQVTTPQIAISMPSHHRSHFLPRLPLNKNWFHKCHTWHICHFWPAQHESRPTHVCWPAWEIKAHFADQTATNDGLWGNMAYQQLIKKKHCQRHK